jgi:hypothetical protein
LDFRLGKTQKEEIRERSASCRENRFILLPIQNLKSKIQNWLSEPLNSGKLILDATCAPADISYPTDIEILNEARKHTILDFRFWILDYNNIIPTLTAVD